MKSKLGRLVLPALIIFLLLEVAVIAFLAGAMWQASQYRHYHPMPTPPPPGEVIAWLFEEPRYAGFFVSVCVTIKDL